MAFTIRSNENGPIGIITTTLLLFCTATHRYGCPSGKRRVDVFGSSHQRGVAVLVVSTGREDRADRPPGADLVARVRHVANIVIATPRARIADRDVFARKD